MLVPSSNTTMETEVPALLRRRERERPEEKFTLHTARLRMDEVTPDALRAMNAQTDRATTELADMRPNVVATACLVAVVAQGPQASPCRRGRDRVGTRAGGRLGAVSSAGALVDALHFLGAREVGIVAPYLKELTRLVVEYVEDAGVEVADAISLEVPDNRAVAALDRKTSRTTGSASTCVMRRSRALRVRADASLSVIEKWSSALSSRHFRRLRRRHGPSCARSTSSLWPQVALSSSVRRNKNRRRTHTHLVARRLPPWRVASGSIRVLCSSCLTSLTGASCATDVATILAGATRQACDRSGAGSATRPAARSRRRS